jgi:hypothetical protein
MAADFPDNAAASGCRYTRGDLLELLNAGFYLSGAPEAAGDGGPFAGRQRPRLIASHTLHRDRSAASQSLSEVPASICDCTLLVALGALGREGYRFVTGPHWQCYRCFLKKLPLLFVRCW